MPSQRFVVVASNRHRQIAVFGPFIETDARAFVGLRMIARPKLEWMAYPLNDADTLTVNTLTRQLARQGEMSATQLLKEGSE